jgi:Domain of unknown function (DUF4396)
MGILAGAVAASYLTLSHPLEMALEYGLGFGFGWTIFQALFMRGMAGGSYRRALATTCMPEFLSMNLVMTGMMLVASLGRVVVGARFRPLTPIGPRVRAALTECERQLRRVYTAAQAHGLTSADQREAA